MRGSRPAFERQADDEGRAFSDAADDVDVAIQADEIAAHDVESDAAARQVSNGVGGRETGCEQKLRERRLVKMGDRKSGGNNLICYCRSTAASIWPRVALWTGKRRHG